MRIVKRIAAAVAALVVLGGVGDAKAAVVYVGDSNGNVGRFDTGTNTGAALGSLAASGISAISATGLAYDPATDSVLIMSVASRAVYTMDATTGAASLLFSTPGVGIYGGAVLDGRLYGLDELSDTAVAYTLDGVPQDLSGGPLPLHAHAMGVDPSAGQLYIARWTRACY